MLKKNKKVFVSAHTDKGYIQAEIEWHWAITGLDDLRELTDRLGQIYPGLGKIIILNWRRFE